MDKESIIKDKFIKNLPKSWIKSNNELDIDIENESYLTDSAINKICKHIPSLINEVKKYEKEQGEYGMYNEVNNFDKLLDSCYIFEISINKRNLSVSFSSRKFEDWMGWYDAYYSLPEGKFLGISFND